MMKGFRVPAQATKKEQFRSMDTEMKNLQQSVRISQMMLKQMMDNMQGMANDISNAMNQLYEMQYKYIAIKEHLNLDPSALDSIANRHRLVDFEVASAKQDTQDNLEVGATVETDSTIVITSAAVDATGADKGIFRSRLKLSECGVPSLIADLAGKQVGDRVQVKLNDVDHLVELLAIRNPKKDQPVEVVS
jgi:hypothetical protein